MLKTGLLNPQILDLLAWVRHTNYVIIADRGFPFWPMIETVDVSLVDDIPSVRQVLEVIMPHYNFGKAYMAEEFLDANSNAVLQEYKRLLGDAEITFESHESVFKPRVPGAIGLIRTGDTTQFGNIILESA